MATKKNSFINGQEYYRLRKVVGHRINKEGKEVPVIKNFYGTSKKDALQQYNEFMNKKKAGIDTAGQYFGIVADNWLHEFFLKDDSLASRTRDLYYTCWKKYVVPSNVYHMPLVDVSASVLQRLYNDLGCPASALVNVNKLMRRFYKYLEREGLARNVTGSLVLPSPEKKQKQKQGENEIVVWTDEEANKILEGFDKAQKGFRLRFLVVAAYYTGCRISELLGLKYEDFDLDNDVVIIRRQIVEKPTFDREKQTAHELGDDSLKTSASYRTLPMNEVFRQEFILHVAWHKEDQLKNGYRTNYVFTTSTGGFYYRKSAAQSLSRYYKRIGVEDKGFHTYRHTFGTNLCKKGVPIQIASSLLGHSDINVTAKYYISVGMEEKRRAVELLKNG